MQYPFTEIHPLTTKVIRLPEGDRHVLTVNAKGFPVDWPNLYCTISLRTSSMALATMQTHATAVCMLHNWCGDRGISLQQRIETLDLFTMEEIAGLRFEMRLNRAPAGTGSRASETVGNPHWNMRLKAIAAYVRWHAEHVISRLSARDERWPSARKRLDSVCKKIAGKIKTRKGKRKEGLEKEARSVFAKAITLGHATNPFAERVQPRNLALLVTYYEGGLRRGEAVGLKCVDMHLNGSEPYVMVERRPDDLDDTRSQEARAKTLAHPVPISPSTARLLGDFMIYDRPTYPGAKKVPLRLPFAGRRPALAQRGRPDVSDAAQGQGDAEALLAKLAPPDLERPGG